MTTDIKRFNWLCWFKFHQLSKARGKQCSGLLIIEPKILMKSESQLK